MTPLLEVRGLTREFGGITAVCDVDFDVRAGQIKALIGPNGAGKTTILNMLAGALTPTRGRMIFDGRPLAAGRPHAVAARGIARTFQLVRLFGDMTVLDNVLVGCHSRGRAGWAASALRTRAMRREEARLHERARLAVLLRAIRDGATTVLLVDHHMEFVLDLSDEVLVVCHGEKLAEDTPAAVRCHPAVVAAYLGDDAAA